MFAAARAESHSEPAGDFWRYSVRLYGRPGISENCLKLQDHAGVDVNLLLFCCWAAFRAAREFDDDEIRGLLGATADWRRGAIEPIRESRRELKALTEKTEDAEFLYEAMKRCELDAEKVQQRLLVQAAGLTEICEKESPDAANIARANIENYFAIREIEACDWIGNAVARIIAAANAMTEKAVTD